MANAKKARETAGGERTIAALNRRARFDYEISDVYEAGLVLTGSEVKSLRTGKATIAEAYAGPNEGEIFLINANIPVYANAAALASHEPKRPRKLLLHKREAAKLLAAVQKQGITLVPMAIYFNKRGRAKLEIGVGKGKKLYDKRESQKNKDWSRDQARLLRSRTRD
jgi:SsrA-binding protein